MRLYSFSNRRIFHGGIVLLLLLAMVLNRDGNYSGTVLTFYQAQFLMYGAIALSGIAFLFCHRRDWRELLTDRRTKFAVVTVVVLLLPMLCKRDWQMMYVTVCIAALFGIFAAYFLTMEDLTGIYLRLLCVLSVFSVLCTYGLRLLPDSEILRVPVVQNVTDEDFYWFGGAFVSVTYVKTRNFGVFREPGVYQFFLLLGLYLNNCEAQWGSKRKYWLVNGILALTMISTFATGGLVELILLAMVLFADRRWYRTKVGKILAGCAVLGTAALVSYAMLSDGLLHDAVTDMLGKFSSGSESMTDRLGSIVQNTRTFLCHPLVGGRLKQTIETVENNTSSSTLLYAVFGIPGGTLNAAAWVLFVWQRRRKTWVNLAMIVILFMSFNTENMITNPYLWLFPMAAVCHRWLPMLVIRKGDKLNGAGDLAESTADPAGNRGRN